MDGTAVKEIERLAQEAAAQVLTFDGVPYTVRPVHDARKAEPEPEPLVVTSLTGFVRYIAAQQDKVDMATVLAVVDSPRAVRLVGPLFGRFQQRYCYVRAEGVDRMAGFQFGTFGPIEDMVIALQSRFQDDSDRAAVIHLLGNITGEHLETLEDDGVSQQVSSRTGVVGRERKTIPNPVHLAPFRTFAEVPQPRSPFVVRLKKGHVGPQVALFEADGGAWRLAAAKAIREYLVAETARQGIEVIG